MDDSRCSDKYLSGRHWGRVAWYTHPRAIEAGTGGERADRLDDDDEWPRGVGCHPAGGPAGHDPALPGGAGGGGGGGGRPLPPAALAPRRHGLPGGWPG